MLFFIYVQCKVLQLLNKSFAREQRVDEREVLEFLLVYVGGDVLVSRRQFRVFSCEIRVEVPYVRSRTLRRGKKGKTFNWLLCYY